MHTDELAVLGGSPQVPVGFRFHPWPEITPEDEVATLASLRQRYHAWGPNAEALEADFLRWNGNRFCAATNSGTAALHMAVAACGAGAGSEIITTSVSWTSTATAILHHNALPVFVDVDPATMNLDPSKIERAIGPKTKAILAVHYWGVPCDMDPICDIARRHGLMVIEDACQAHGALYKGRKVGTIGHLAAFSLNQMKLLSAGEGGLFVTNDASLWTRARSLMNFGQMDDPGRHARSTHAYGMGWMYRTSDLPAALARSQLARLDEIIRRSRENQAAFAGLVQNLPNAVLPSASADCETNGYAYPLRIDPAAAERRGVPAAKLRDAVAKALVAEGIPTHVPNWMLPAHTVFKAKNGYGEGCPWTCHLASRPLDYDLAQYPVARQCVDTVLWFAARDTHPLRPPNGAEEVALVAAAVRKVFEAMDRVPI